MWLTHRAGRRSGLARRTFRIGHSCSGRRTECLLAGGATVPLEDAAHAVEPVGGLGGMDTKETQTKMRHRAGQDRWALDVSSSPN